MDKTIIDNAEIDEEKLFINYINKLNKKIKLMEHKNKELKKENQELKLQLDNYKNNPEMQKALTYYRTGEYDIQISILEKENKKLKAELSKDLFFFRALNDKLDDNNKMLKESEEQ